MYTRFTGRLKLVGRKMVHAMLLCFTEHVWIRRGTTYFFSLNCMGIHYSLEILKGLLNNFWKSCLRNSKITLFCFRYPSCALVTKRWTFLTFYFLASFLELSVIKTAAIAIFSRSSKENYSFGRHAEKLGFLANVLYKSCGWVFHSICQCNVLVMCIRWFLTSGRSSINKDWFNIKIYFGHGLVSSRRYLFARDKDWLWYQSNESFFFLLLISTHEIFNKSESTIMKFNNVL